MNFSGKTVVITGGGSGIGAAMARRFSAVGSNVCVADRDLAGATTVANEIGGTAFACDVTKETQINSLIKAVQDQFGPIDIFVSNAGLGQGDPDHAASSSNDVWQLNWDVHVMSHVYAARALLPGMIERGSGYFVNVASAAGLLNQIGDAAYSATKHAAVSFAESLAITHGDDGIGVSVVCPQYVATPLIGLSDADAEGRETLLTADDVAQSVIDGVSAGRFLILTHPQVAGYTNLRAQDHDKWITGMQKLRGKAIKTFGSASALDLHKLM